MPLSCRPHIQTSPLDLSVWDSDAGVDPGFNLLETTHKGWGQFRFTVEIPDSKLTPSNLPAERFSSSGGAGRGRRESSEIQQFWGGEGAEGEFTLVSPQLLPKFLHVSVTWMPPP